MNPTARILLPLFLLVAGCSALGGGDLATMRAAAQGRFDEIQAANLVFDRLIAQPAPSNLTPAQRRAWDDQTAWLIRTKTKLLNFNTSLRRVLDAPHPSGTGIDGVMSGAQLVSDYARMGDDFVKLMAELTVEAEEDDRRIAEAEGGVRTVPPAGGDSTRVDSVDRSKQIVLSSPLKTRHDTAASTMSSLS
jgi:hypothetical protein